MAKRLFTSESVTEGHPDKICDQISDAVLDAILEKDPNGRVACETTVSTGLVHIMGEITTSCYVDIPKIAREVIRSIGYDRAKYGFDCDTCGERFATETEGADGGQIGGGAELARRVAQKGGGQLVGRDAAAVVRDAQIGQPAVLQLDGDVPRARVDGVFQKLLDNARGTLDDLASGDEIGDMGG